MTENSKIEWTDHTFNPWEGCQKVGPGCDHCYAETRNARFGGGTAINWGPGAPRRRTSPGNWRKPLAWNKAHAEFFAEHGRRQRVFCASLADVFDNAVDPQWRVDLWALIDATPNLDWLLLTKRIGIAPSWIALFGLPENAWLGISVVNQEEADRDIPKLLAVPAAKRFLSMEPLLGAVDLSPWLDIYQYEEGGTWGRKNIGHLHDMLDWVIVGGESGAGARPMHPHWPRSLRDQCDAAGVPFLFKQWGEFLPADDDVGDPFDGRCYWSDGSPWHPGDGQRGGVELMARIGKKAAGRLLDGVQHDGYPVAA